jgi:hypothetical protein
MSDPLEDFVDNPTEFVRRVADQRVVRLEQELAYQKLQSNQDRVYRVLDADPQLGSKWRALNEDPGFLAWLAQVDPLSNEERLKLLRHAYQVGDAARCRNFLLGYLAEQTPSVARTKERLPFESGRSRPRIGTADLTTPGRTWTRQEITDFYSDVMAGLYAEREQEKIRIEHDIVAAARERRVLNPPVQGSK